jgi:aminoglycoside phosphotransferase (APT) family kinase protein
MTDIPGLNLLALTQWLDTTSPGLRVGSLQASMIAGGKSNLTYRVWDEQSHWALRRPPLGHVLPTAHDMGREFRVISGLAPMGIPVPPPVLFCADATVLGAQFYLMGFVDGAVIDTAAAVAAIPGQATAGLGWALIDSLLELHNVDPGAAGLADFGRPEGFMQRQLKRWDAQWQASVTEPSDTEAAVVRELSRAVPAAGPPAIVHGDYRLSNVIFAHSLDRVAAIVDWEMATLGDPLADVGLLYVYHHLAQTSDVIMPIMTPETGFPGPDDLVARYADASERDLSSLPWYIAFGYFKLAVIAQGIAARHLQGQTVGAGFEDMGSLVPGLLDTALRLLTR